MSKVLLTGGTGLLGNNIARQLVADGREVRALVRSLEKARRLLPEQCECIAGDVTDIESIRRAAAGCSVVYHAAGLPEQWTRDPSIFHRVNVEGTRNMVQVALEKQIERFVYSSTIDVFEGRPGQEFDEQVIAGVPKGTEYERSKQAADRVVVEAEDRGLPAILLHPSAIYGPGPTGSPGLNDFIRRLMRGEIPMLLPGGMPVVYSHDVARGHVLAEQKARIGSRYILTDSYRTLQEIAQAVHRIAGEGRVPPMMPLWFASLVSRFGERVARWTGRPPLIPAGQLHFLMWEAHPTAKRARGELGWRPIEIEDGLKRTIDFLRL